METDPLYLTNPEAALAERQAWEDHYYAVAVEVLSGRSLTAAAPVPTAGMPPWPKIVRGLSARLISLPPWAWDYLTPQSGDDREVLARKIADLSTAAYNIHVLAELAERGYFSKVWITRKDPGVRESHRVLQGRRRKLSNPFVVGGFLMQYPADRKTAPIGEWANCRCVLVGSKTAPPRT